jgi:hypothetical protein
MAKKRAHRATDDFRVPEVNGSRHRNGRSNVERGRGAQDRADVARVLNGVKHEYASALG